MWTLPAHALPAATRSRHGDVFRGGHAAVRGVPKLDQRAGRDVEAAAAFGVERRGEIEEIGGLGVDVEARARIRARADRGNEAVVAVMRILAVEPFDFGLRRGGRGARHGRILRFELDLARTTHRGEAEALRLHAGVSPLKIPSAG